MVFTFAVVCEEGVYRRDPEVREYGGEFPTASGSASLYLDGLKTKNEIGYYSRETGPDGVPVNVEGVAVYRLNVKYGTGHRLLAVRED